MQYLQNKQKNKQQQNEKHNKAVEEVEEDKEEDDEVKGYEGVIDLDDIGMIDNDHHNETEANTANAIMKEEQQICIICGETMLPSQPFSYYLHHLQDKADHEMDLHALSCPAFILSGEESHTYCLSCWKQHLTIQITDNTAGTLSCPGYKCNAVLASDWAKVLLSPELYTTYLTQRQRQIVDLIGGKVCPHSNCGLILCPFITTTTATTVTSSTNSTNANANNANATSFLPKAGICSKGHALCLTCLQPAHSPCTCNQLPQWQALVQEEVQKTQQLLLSAKKQQSKKKSSDVEGEEGGDGEVEGEGGGTKVNVEEIANALWITANTKRCPRCGTAIEKDEGCNHMSCRKCRKEFCWICMQDWTLHSDNTGGYFQCNRFLDPSLLSDNNGDHQANEDEDIDMLWGEEQGNAHAETMRLQARNKAMARFIHYFTRYTAHAQSVGMETRMLTETISRLSHSLDDTRSGKLLWLLQASVSVPMPDTSLFPTAIGSNEEEKKGGDSTVEKEEAAAAAAVMPKQEEEVSIYDWLASVQELDETIKQEILQEHELYQLQLQHNTNANSSAKGKGGDDSKGNSNSNTVGIAKGGTEEDKIIWKELNNSVYQQQSLLAYQYTAYTNNTTASTSRVEECIVIVRQGFEELFRCRYVSVILYIYYTII